MRLSAVPSGESRYRRRVGPVHPPSLPPLPFLRLLSRSFSSLPLCPVLLFLFPLSFLLSLRTRLVALVLSFSFLSLLFFFALSFYLPLIPTYFLFYFHTLFLSIPPPPYLSPLPFASLSLSPNLLSSSPSISPSLSPPLPPCPLPFFPLFLHVHPCHFIPLGNTCCHYGSDMATFNGPKPQDATLPVDSLPSGCHVTGGQARFHERVSEHCFICCSW